MIFRDKELDWIIDQDLTSKPCSPQCFGCSTKRVNMYLQNTGLTVKRYDLHPSYTDVED